MIFFAYALNLPLNTQRPHHRSQRAGKLGLCGWILAHGSRLIYCAPTYIAVPIHGPNQPRYIGLTLYYHYGYLANMSHIQYHPWICHLTSLVNFFYTLCCNTIQYNTIQYKYNTVLTRSCNTNYVLNTEAKTKWLPFSGHFQMLFFSMKIY